MPNTLDYERLSPGAPHNFPLWLAILLTFMPIVWMYWISKSGGLLSIPNVVPFIATIAFIVNVVGTLIALVLLIKLNRIRPRRRAIWVRDIYWWWFIMGSMVGFAALFVHA